MLEKLPKGHGDATCSVTNFSSADDVIPSKRADAVHAIPSARTALDVQRNLHIYIFQVCWSRKKVTPTQILLTLFHFLYEFSWIVKSTTCYMANLPSTLTRQGWTKQARLHGLYRPSKLANSKGLREQQDTFELHIFFVHWKVHCIGHKVSIMLRKRLWLDAILVSSKQCFNSYKFVLLYSHMYKRQEWFSKILDITYVFM